MYKPIILHIKLNFFSCISWREYEITNSNLLIGFSQENSQIFQSQSTLTLCKDGWLAIHVEHLSWACMSYSTLMMMTLLKDIWPFDSTWITMFNTVMMTSCIYYQSVFSCLSHSNQLFFQFTSCIVILQGQK